LAYQGEYFVERYGSRAAEATPPVARILSSGVHASAGTDATRVASYNPWVCLSWLVTGRTAGGLRLYPERVWLGAGAIAVLTAIATFVANDFWNLQGHARFTQMNAFFEHWGLIAGCVLAALLAEREQRERS